MVDGPTQLSFEGGATVGDQHGIKMVRPIPIDCGKNPISPVTLRLDGQGRKRRAQEVGVETRFVSPTLWRIVGEDGAVDGGGA